MKSTRYLFFLLLLFNFLSCSGQNNPGRHPKFYGCWTGFDNYFNHCADSLNFIVTIDQLPVFLTDHLIDWKQRKLFSSCVFDSTERISIRKVIMDRVYREDVLEWIINSKTEAYGKVYVPEQLRKEMNYYFSSFPDFPFMEFSWRQLAKKRLDDIRKTKDLFKKK